MRKGKTTQLPQDYPELVLVADKILVQVCPITGFIGSDNYKGYHVEEIQTNPIFKDIESLKQMENTIVSDECTFFMGLNYKKGDNVKHITLGTEGKVKCFIKYYDLWFTILEDKNELNYLTDGATNYTLLD